MAADSDAGARALDRLDTIGAAAPPRENGELVFVEPWESRVFGLAIALCERGVFGWEEFRERLIAEITRWESGRAGRPDDTPYRYYERWQAALEALLADKRICAADDLDGRERHLARRPAGHDH